MLKFAPHIQKTFPEIIGPGLWYDIHHMAMRAKTDETKHRFEDRMNYLRAEFPCASCKPHLNRYMAENPLKQWANIKDAMTGEDIGYFTWTVNFHNAVNRRLGKPEISYTTAYNMFVPKEEGGVCATCDSKSASIANTEGKSVALQNHNRSIPLGPQGPVIIQPFNSNVITVPVRSQASSTLVMPSPQLVRDGGFRLTSRNR